jgi:hypothetical protein
MKNYAKLVLALFALVSGTIIGGLHTNEAHAQTSRKANCEIVYQGVTKLNRTGCDFEPIPGAPRGSFGVGQDLPGKVFIGMVTITGNGVGDATYMGRAGSVIKLKSAPPRHHHYQPKLRHQPKHRLKRRPRDRAELMRAKFFHGFARAMLVLGAFIAGHIQPAHAQADQTARQIARQMDCEVVVDGETKIKSLCDFRPITGHGVGSFRIVNWDDAKTGNALFGTISDGEEELVNPGVVTRNGHCWAGNGLKVCARSLTRPAAKTKAPAKAPPPKAPARKVAPR